MASKKFFVHIDLNGQQILKLVPEILSSNPVSPATGQMWFNTTSGKFYGYNGTDIIDLSQVINNPMTLKGEISNASTNPSYPSSPTIGDVWIVTTEAGTVGGVTVEVGDQLVYGSSGWFAIQTNIGQASTTTPGYIQIATQTEVNTGTDNAKSVTPLTLATLVAALNTPKSYSTTVALAADTPLLISHNLNLSDKNKYVIRVSDPTTGDDYVVTSQGSTVNATYITSNIEITSAFVFIIGV
jgi:hypothetical protein